MVNKMRKRTDAEEFRRFAITVFCALGIVGGLFLWRKGEVGLVFWATGVVILLVGLLRPELLGPIYKGWMRLATVMGFFMTHIILALIYYLVFTPLGLVMRIIGRDPLRVRSHQVDSYWIKKDKAGLDKERYTKMF